MRRRTYLLGLGTSLTATAGYMTIGGDDAVPSFPREISNLSVKGLQESDLVVDATIEQPEITAEHTAGIRLTVTWTGDGEQGMAFGNTIPFGSPQQSDHPEGLLLLKEGHRFARENNETWVPDTGDSNDLPSLLNLRVASLAPGESVSQTWRLWATPGKAEYIRADQYIFRNSISLMNPDLESAESVDWSLTIEIEG